MHFNTKHSRNLRLIYLSSIDRCGPIIYRDNLSSRFHVGIEGHLPNINSRKKLFIYLFKLNMIVILIGMNYYITLSLNFYCIIQLNINSIIILGEYFCRLSSTSF